MALFSRKKRSEAEKAVAEPAAKKAAPVFGAEGLSHILQNPRITEKATLAASMSVYVFDVSPRANKKDIAKAVEQYYKVVPRKVAVVSIPEKRVRSARTGARGVKQGGKKAYVYLKKGETITIT